MGEEIKDTHEVAHTSGYVYIPASNTQDPIPTPCPTCGHCPTCGRKYSPPIYRGPYQQPIVYTAPPLPYTVTYAVNKA